MQVSGDKITVDAEKLQLTVDLSDAELKSRKDAWKQPPVASPLDRMEIAILSHP